MLAQVQGQMQHGLAFDSQEIIELLSYHMQMGFLITNKDDLIIYLDSFVHSLCSTEDIKPQQSSFYELSQPLLKFVKHIYNSGKKDLKPQYFNGLPLISEHSSSLYLSGFVMPILEQSQFAGMFCAFRDITEYKKLEKLLNQAQEELDKSIQKRTELLRQSNRKLQEEVWKRKRKEQELLEINQRFQNLFDNVGEGICSLTLDGMLIEANSSLALMLGYANPEELKVSMTNIPEQLFVDNKQWEYLVRKMLHDGIMHRNEVQLRTKNEPIWTELTALLVHTKWGQKYLHVIVSNITERKNKELALYHQATMDNLTQVPNRSLYMDRLEQTLKKARRYNESFSIFFLDLDGFKEINDHYGHQAGDELLVEACKRIQTQIRDSDTLSRMGGDEFCLILNNLQIPEDAEQLASKIIQSLKLPFQINDSWVRIGVSIGICFYEDPQTTALEMVHKADSAMYQAKTRGGDTWAFHREIG